ncbi:uroporphyrinogen-III synthase [Salirhabdus euzebyi]|uniref:Uroporphyrinogen-III synthase n=1 Tax=Salirhabdus euzebyi TaxID=394506 RepID=A0A841Q1C0_9BACI|nr:uroporphyrinogen-III synthase [Salirhabdus euzebyi]MBB6451933.1 uroporphyrinogen-III synthase [Salirhabdus euzebyi]
MTLPLQGKRILVTRGKKQSNSMSRLIKKYGGEPIEVPLITFDLVLSENTKRIMADLEKFDWIFFTSANGIHYFYESLKRYDLAIPSAKIGVVGKKSDEILSQYGLTATFIPDEYSAAEMGRVFTENFHAKNVLLVQGSLSRNVLENALIEHCIPFSTVTVYTTKYNDSAKELLQKVLTDQHLDVLTFTSPSCVDAFFALGGDSANKYKETVSICIGTTTEKEAQKKGFTHVLTPSNFTIPDMIHTLVQYCQKELDENE